MQYNLYLDDSRMPLDSFNYTNNKIYNIVNWKVVRSYDEFVDAVSALARSSRYAQIQILVKDTKPLVESGHKLVRLAQRLSSKIAIRKLTVEADDKDMGFMLCDSSRLLYKNDEAIYQGFANFEASVEVKRFRDTFDYLWQYGETDPDLQQLHI